MRNVVISGVLAICLGAGALRASVVDTSINNAADKILANQSADGSWFEQSTTDYTGTIASGLVFAYQRTGNSAYLTGAQNAAGFFMNLSSIQGDEAYTLAQLSAVQPNPNNNAYRSAAQTYFSNTHAAAGGTQGVINSVVNHYTSAYNEQSQAVVYLAYYTVASDQMNATDKSIWRNGLISTLGQIDDADYFPVGSLGMAVWALAQTGNGLSGSTTVSGPSTILNGMTLAQLPGLLASEVVSSGPNAGTFYGDFGQTFSGYTQDTAMGLMGLEAAYSADSSLNYGSLISGSQLALTNAIGGDGSAYLDIAHDSPILNVYGGQTLAALSGSVPEPASASVLLSLGTMYLIGRRRRAAH